MAVLNERGTSLLEAVAALFILSVVAVGILPAFAVQLDANTRNEIRAGAVSASQVVMEALRAEDPSQMLASGQGPMKYYTIGKNRYEVITHYCLKPEFCDDTTRYLYVEVYLDGRKVYDAETVQTSLQTP